MTSISACLKTDGELARFRAMGFVPGARIEIIRDRWPFPYHVRIGSTEYIVRRRELPKLLQITQQQ